MCPVEFSLAHRTSRGLFAMSLNQIFMWEVSIIIPTNVKYRIINIYNKLFFKVQWNLTSHWNLRFQFSSQLSPIELVLSKGKTKQTGSLLPHQIKGGCDERRSKYS